MMIIVVSPACDHADAEYYANWMVNNGKSSDWAGTYRGARFELAIARLLGELVQCQNNLRNVATARNFRHDLIVKGKKLDDKAAGSHQSSPNLIVNTCYDDVYYVLGQALEPDTRRGGPATDKSFRVLGGKKGDSPVWTDCPFAGTSVHGKPMVWAKDLDDFCGFVRSL